MKIVINTNACFRLSEEAYEFLIKHGIPVRRYVDQEFDPETGRYLPQPLNDGEVIFDLDLKPKNERTSLDEALYRGGGRYWDCWLRDNRTHPLLIQAVETLGARASGWNANLKVVEIPDGVEYTIETNDGRESIHEKHRVWS